MEIWKDIKDYEGYYQVSNYGRVKNVKTDNILVGDINNAGYKRVYLYQPTKKRFFIHRLVALHFCEGYTKDLVVNHKDGDKLNNNADNLEWITRSENDLHAFKMNLRKCCPSKFKHSIQAFKNNILIKEYKNVQECCDDLKVARTNIYNCCNGKQLTCRGYKLKYKE